MSAPTNPQDAAGCLELAQRRVGDTSGWTPEQWQKQLGEDAVQRGDPPVAYYRPYKAAVAYLLRPRVKARTEGDVSEQLDSITELLEELRSLDAEWLSDRIPPVTTQSVSDEFDGTVDWGSW